MNKPIYTCMLKEGIIYHGSVPGEFQKQGDHIYFKSAINGNTKTVKPGPDAVFTIFKEIIK